MAENIYRKIDGNGDDWVKSLEPKIVYTFAEGGTYQVRVKDLTHRNGPDTFRYRPLMREPVPHVGRVSAAFDLSREATKPKMRTVATVSARVFCWRAGWWKRAAASSPRAATQPRHGIRTISTIRSCGINSPAPGPVPFDAAYRPQAARLARKHGSCRDGRIQADAIPQPKRRAGSLAALLADAAGWGRN